MSALNEGVTLPTTDPGCVVLAAHHPSPDTFKRQLRSIAEQSIREWVTLISCDSDPELVGQMVRDAVGQDPRFVVLPGGSRVGFYRNFERGLAAVPANAGWVALADQDDDWFPDKLEVLVARLANASLATCQAVVTRGEERHGPTTSRRAVALNALLVDNQVTGSFSVMRRQVLDVALPFPDAPDGAFHDHWLGVCATVLDGVVVVDQALQAYVQHDDNVIGESGAGGLGARVRRLLRGGPREVRRRLVVERLGWRRTMAREAAARCPSSDAVPTLHMWAETRVALFVSLAIGAVTRRAPLGRSVGLALAVIAEGAGGRDNRSGASPPLLTPSERIVW
jgi:Zn ribbon nucleic-acid-binding protein